MKKKKQRLLRVLAILERESSPLGERASAAQRIAELLLGEPALAVALREGISAEAEDASEAVYKQLSQARMALQEAEHKIAALERALAGRGQRPPPSMPSRPRAGAGPAPRGGLPLPLPPPGIRDPAQWWAQFSREASPPFFSAGLFARLPGAPGAHLHVLAHQLPLGAPWALEDASGRPWMVSALRPTSMDEVCRFGAQLFAILGEHLAVVNSPSGQRRRLR